jgi:GTP-binding protein
MQHIFSAIFKGSNTDYRDCPPSDLPEFAFVGRSNVGKSSLINMLTGIARLAKTSSTPGKTQLINHFLINDAWYLVDLPGYGYAKASKKDAAAWKSMVTNYLLHRTNLVTTFVLIDSRHDPLAIDLQFMKWMGQNGLPFAMVFTKSDKLTVAERNRNRKKYENTMLESWETLPPIFVTSAEKKTGNDELLSYIASLLGNGG